MKQVVQSVGDGTLKVIEVPQPTPDPTQVLVATRRSLVSSGTERAVRELASSNLLQKARARPDLVRQVVRKARAEGPLNTLKSVRTRLDEDMALGYSAAGIVIEAGSAAPALAPGTRVATASAGHAEIQAVPGLLAVPIPDEVTDAAAAFGAVAAIAMQGLRQAEVAIGGSVCVVGLGLVGQLTARLAAAAGLRVIGVDLRDWTAALVSETSGHGLVEAGADTTEAIKAMTGGLGVDAVLLTAATKSSDPAMLAVERCRDRGRVVVVGDVGLHLQRTPFYMKEVDIRFARSYGPGRYDRSYEEYAVDYPIGQVRWTEGRNIEAYLDLVASGRVAVEDLVTHVFPVDEAPKAYETISADPRALAVQFSYDLPAVRERRAITLLDRASSVAADGVGLVGAGNFAKMTLVPAMRRAGWERIDAVTSSGGLTARHLAERHAIARVDASVEDLLESDVSTVFVLSRHDSHAEIAAKALRAGKNVFVEKPLALSDDELDEVLSALADAPGQLWMGFNRRHSDAARRAAAALPVGAGPVVATYRVSAGRLPDTHWYKDRRQGGRLLGEVCHFVDLVSWIIGSRPVSVYAAGSGVGEGLLQEDLALIVRYEDGSLGTVTYAENGHATAPKERLELLGRGHAVVIDDFKGLSIDGKDIKLEHADKGHVANLVEFRRAVQSGRSSRDLEVSIDTTQVMLAAVKSLLVGEAQWLAPSIDRT